MPIYEYLCLKCGAVSEHLVFNASEPIRCPECDGGELKKLLSVTSDASGVSDGGRLPGPGDTSCCGHSPGSQGCVPGSCCGKAGH